MFSEAWLFLENFTDELSPARAGGPGTLLRNLLFPCASVANGKWHIDSHYPTQAKVRLDPDFLPRCARKVRVCAFH